LSEAANHFQRFRRVGFVRLGFLALMVVLLLIWALFSFSFWWAVVALIGFLILAPLQQNIAEARRRCERSADLYRKGLERLDDNWVGKGSTGEHFVSDAHPYAEDLDLFGVGSLFELLCRARTRVGENTLAQWLLNPSSTPVVHSRQAAVDELRSRVELREDLALLAEGIHSGSDAQVLIEWTSASRWNISKWLRFVSFALAVLSLGGLLLWWLGFGALCKESLVQLTFPQRICS
jgi:hypothetical protein